MWKNPPQEYTILQQMPYKACFFYKPYANDKKDFA